MNMLFGCASRLIVIGAFALIVPTLAWATDVQQPEIFRLAMGPMSAAQKNQGQGWVSKPDGIELNPRRPLKPRHHVKHRHHRE